MADRTLNVQITGDAAPVNNTLGDVESKGNSVAKSINESWVGLKAGIDLVKEGYDAVKEVYGEMLGEYQEGRAAELDLTAALQAHGQEIDKNVAAAKAYSAQLMQTFDIDDDKILKLEAMGAQYGVTGGDIEQFALATIAWSKRTGQAEEDSARQVEGALSGKTKSFDRLGVQIDKTADSHTKLAEIIGGLQGEIQGATANANDYAGQVDILNLAWGNVLATGFKLIAQNPDVLAFLKGTSGALQTLADDLDTVTGDFKATGDQSKLTAAQVKADWLEVLANVEEYGTATVSAVKIVFLDAATVIDTTVADVLHTLDYALGGVNKLAHAVGLPGVDLTGLENWISTMHSAAEMTARLSLGAENAQGTAAKVAVELRSQAEEARHLVDASAQAAGGSDALAGSFGNVAAKGGKAAQATEALAGKFAALGDTAKVTKTVIDDLYSGQGVDDMYNYVQGALADLTGGELGIPGAHPADETKGRKAGAKSGVGSKGKHGGLAAKAAGTAKSLVDAAAVDDGSEPGVGNYGGSGYGLIPFGANPLPAVGNARGTYAPGSQPWLQARGLGAAGGGAGAPSTAELLEYFLSRGLITKQDLLSHLVDPHEGSTAPFGPGGHLLTQFGSLGHDPAAPMYVQLVGPSAATLAAAIGAVRR
jgi:hypothetical protein